MKQLLSENHSSMKPNLKLSRKRISYGLVRTFWLCCLFLSGCGSSGNGYQAVTGTVKFQGQPIQEGAIQFCTDSKPPIVHGGAMIRDGKYQLPRDHGLAPGNYLVRITSTERIDNPDKAKNEMAPFFTRERIPTKYNIKSELKVEVASGKPTEYNIDLK